ncbi:MAG: S49 family peptidase, partial [Calditrichaeota bacterium]|nr:S49 family peptidase [Calditrichota bacterium]
MKHVVTVILILLFAASASFAEFYLPAYYSQSDFLANTPGSAGDASGAIFNPAIWGMMKGPEVQFFWNDLEKTGTNSNNWALSMGGDGLGFSMQHWDYGENVGNQIQRYKMNDFTIGMGGGTQEFSTGFSYSWTKGDQALGMMRDNVLSAGVIARHCRYSSVGLAGHYALNEKDVSGVLDIGLRPLGTPMLTVFADAALASNETIDDLKWGAGASVEPLAGIALSAKYFENESVMFGLTWTMGATSVKVMPHFDKDFKQSYNTYGVRVGFPKNDLLSPIVMKDKFYYDLTFNSGIKYRRYKYFDKKGHTLMELLKTLEQINNDPRFSGLVIKITEEMYGSPEVIWEVREKMKELQANGKKIVVFLERGDMMEYYLASVADEIMVDPSCTVGMFGFAFGRSYYKRALEKLGIGFDEWRFFKYKSALEGFSETEMTEGDREQRQALADGFYEIYRKDICESRGITHEEFDYIVDNVGILIADSLIAYNLADTTGRWNEMDDLLKEVDGKGKARIGKHGLMAMTTQDDEWGIKPRIAVIYGLGPCAMNYGLNARKLGPVIERARNDKNVKAVVFRADSPGGDILPSDIVALELKKTAEEKPVIVTQGQVAGSGGYWISMYGDKILASPWTITGSIGVIGGWFYNDGFNDKLGMD